MTPIVQSGYYKLTSRLFAAALRRSLVLCAMLFFLTLVLLMSGVDDTSFSYAYETHVRYAGIRFVFLCALAVWAVLETAQIYADNFRSGGIYTLMMLPFPRRHVYLSYCTVGAVCVLMLFTAQLLALLAAYPIVEGLCRNAAAAYEKASVSVLPFKIARTNGLFLAVLRSELFHILLPLSIPEALGSVLTVGALGCVPAQILTGLQRPGKAVVMMASLAAALWAVYVRFDVFVMGVSTEEFVAGMVLSVLVIGTATYGACRLNHDACLVGW